MPFLSWAGVSFFGRWCELVRARFFLGPDVLEQFLQTCMGWTVVVAHAKGLSLWQLAVPCNACIQLLNILCLR